VGPNLTRTCTDHYDQPEHTAGRHLLPVVQAATNTERI